MIYDGDFATAMLGGLETYDIIVDALGDKLKHNKEVTNQDVYSGLIAALLTVAVSFENDDDVLRKTADFLISIQRDKSYLVLKRKFKNHKDSYV